MTALSGYLVQALLTLALLAAVAVAIVWWAKKWMAGAQAGSAQMRIVDQMLLGFGVRLVIVEIADRRFLLAITQQHVTMLCELPPAEHGE